MSVKSKRQTSSVTRKSAARKKRSSGGKDVSEVLLNLVLPLMLILIMLGALGYLGFIGYKGATRSDFFRAQHVVVQGNKKINADEVRGVVEANAGNGLWAANLEQIQNAVLGKFVYAKSVAVSRQLPDTVTVSIVERVPAAIVRMGNADKWVDEDGVDLGSVEKGEDRTGWLVMTGWYVAEGENDKSDADRKKSERENRDRVKMYRKVREDWSTFNLVTRVKEIDLSDLSNLKAVVDKDGPVEIWLGKDDFAKRLETAVNFVAQSSDPVGALDARDPDRLRILPKSEKPAKSEKKESKDSEAGKKKEEPKASKQDSTKDKKTDSPKKKN